MLPCMITGNRWLIIGAKGLVLLVCCCLPVNMLLADLVERRVGDGEGLGVSGWICGRWVEGEG